MDHKYNNEFSFFSLTVDLCIRSTNLGEIKLTYLLTCEAVSKIQSYFSIIVVTLQLWIYTQLFVTSLELNLDRKGIHLSSMKPDLFAMSASKHKSVSYRRNRDYSKQFNWTYELNQGLYECYNVREILFDLLVSFVLNYLDNCVLVNIKVSLMITIRRQNETFKSFSNRLILFLTFEHF